MGGKSVHIDSMFQLQKCDDANHHTGDDCLSRLPDDILVGILSILPLKEAGRTSILSPHWENLWKHTFHLNFDAHSALCRIVKNPKLRTLEREKYINWVNKVIRSYKGFTLKELRICFDLDKSSGQKAINRWLRFAFERRVERLELDLSEEGDYGRCENVCALPIKMFEPHRPRSLFNSLNYLKALSLKSVDVTDQDVEEILLSCPLLENLVFDRAQKLLNINICGAVALKHLEFCYCQRVESIKVSAPNLISLSVTNAAGKLLLENVPKLVDVFVSSCDEQVPKLELMEKYGKCELPELHKLKKLEIDFWGRGDESMIGLTCLTKAAPYLQEFVIKIGWHKLLKTKRNVKNEIHSPHQHLKVVKFLGYYGRSSDVELIRYLVDNCVVLETLIIDPRYQPFFRYAPLNPDQIDGLVIDAELPKSYEPVMVYPEKFDELDAVRTSRKYAKKQLQGQIPQHIELVIL